MSGAQAAEQHAEVRKALRSRDLVAVLEPAERAGGGAAERLLADLARLDWAELDRQRAALEAGAPAAGGEIRPPELAPPSTDGSPATREAATAGWEALRAGRVALATVAGGQASRLGFDGPKGAYPLGPVSGASLFQMMAGQVQRLRERSGAELPWIIQTGPGNHEDTERYFARRNFFGLAVGSVRFVCQGTLPALSADGELLLAAPDRLFRSPDGHGGFYHAVCAAGEPQRLRAAGIDTLFYCQVDNPLVRMGDPAFLGHHLRAGAQMSVKVVEKTEPSEKVGMVVERGGRVECIEYSDLPEEMAAERADDGGLRFRAGNIAIHAFGLDFVEAMAGEGALPLHLARKQVVALDGGLEAVAREGVKFETFVFDALPRAERAVVQLCMREEEFAPVKNRSGVDSAETSRAALNARARAWCAQALSELEPAPSGALEIEPGLGYDAADLADRADRVELRAGGHLLASKR